MAPLSQNPVSTDTSRRLVLRSGAVPLPEWLDLAWFYPQGFRKESIIETPRSWVVIGNEFVYKFLKVPGADENAPGPDFFRERWRLACEEVIDNRALAPHLYVGLRLLRWIDNEPEWVSETPSETLDPLGAPANADDVAIVMRRVPKEQLAHQILHETGALPGPQLLRLADSIRTFHSRRADISVSPFLRSPAAVVESLRAHYVEPLNSFILSDSSYLDPFSQIALEELRGYLSRFLENNLDLFGERLKLGAYVDCHGALRADRIAFGKNREVSVFGRLTRLEPMRLADSLSDVAALAADLEARGYPAIARRFEENYFRREEPVPQKLYRFYKIAETARRAQILLRGQIDDAHVQAPSYLSLGLRLALNLDGAYLIVIGGTNLGQSVSLGRSAEALTGSPVVTAESLGPQWNYDWTPDPVRLERMLTLGESKFSRGKGLVIVWPLNREEERLQIQRYAEARNIRLLFVSLDGGKGNGEGRRLRSLGADYSQLLPELKTRHVLLQAGLPPADLAMMMLRELRQAAL